MMMAANTNNQDEDYIQDGLVFHLDCADYNPTLNTWIDKIGNVSFTMSNVTVDSLGGIMFNGSNSGGTSNVSVRCPVDTSTIEIVINASKARNQFIFDSGTSGSLAYTFYNRNVICGITTKRRCPIINSISNGFLTNSVHYGSNLLHVENGNIGSFTSQDDYWSYRNKPASIGVRSDNTYWFLGTIYQIRIYNKHLTADEMIHNQRIDMRKYNSN
jgi:hypothetical protein